MKKTNRLHLTLEQTNRVKIQFPDEYSTWLGCLNELDDLVNQDSTQESIDKKHRLKIKITLLELVFLTILPELHKENIRPICFDSIKKQRYSSE
jgi:hypothetical protein